MMRSLNEHVGWGLAGPEQLNIGNACGTGEVVPPEVKVTVILSEFLQSFDEQCDV